jgi:hypothetical protein
MRAAGLPPIKTVAEPLTIVSGGPVQVAMSPKQAAGIPPIKTVKQPNVMGPPTWGIGGTPGVTIGQTCISLTLAAGGILDFRFMVLYFIISIKE